jgi:hypothetical protein
MAVLEFLTQLLELQHLMQAAVVDLQIIVHLDLQVELVVVEPVVETNQAATLMEQTVLLIQVAVVVQPTVALLLTLLQVLAVQVLLFLNILTQRL